MSGYRCEGGMELIQTTSGPNEDQQRGRGYRCADILPDRGQDKQSQEAEVRARVRVVEESRHIRVNEVQSCC
jgi:hypothetical protein